MKVVFNRGRMAGRALAPRFGKSSDRVPTWNTVLSLIGLGTVDVVEQSIKVKCSKSEFAYFAVPETRSVEFIDPATGFYGGWDGALDDPYHNPGFAKVSGVLNGRPVIFNVFRTDHSGLGALECQALVR